MTKFLPTILLPTKISTEYFSKNTITVTINFDPRKYNFHLIVAFRQFTEQFSSFHYKNDDLAKGDGGTVEDTEPLPVESEMELVIID